MSLPSPGSEAEARGVRSATIGKAVKIVGQIYSKEDLFVDGDVEGSLEAPRPCREVGGWVELHQAQRRHLGCVGAWNRGRRDHCRRHE